MVQKNNEQIKKFIEKNKLSAEDYPYEKEWVIREGDNIIGFIGVESSGDNHYIQSLAVEKDRRKKGIGKRLVEMAKKEYSSLIALTLFWNGRFYEGLGFKKVNAKETKAKDPIGRLEKHKHCTAYFWKRNK